IRCPDAGATCAAAARNAASGPLASTAPRPHSSSFSTRTGISPGTVSAWPRRTCTVSPSPRSATKLPASSRRVRNPRSRPAEHGARAALELDAEHEPAAADLAYERRGELLELREEMRPDFPGVLDHPLLLDRVERGQRRRAHHRPAAERRPVREELERRHARA